MNLKKTVTIAAAAGALAAISVPAMAFENEFHGIYNLKFFVSNYENGGTTTIDPSKYKNDNKANNFFEQRARLQYTAKASDDLKLVTHFELDTKFGGDRTGKYQSASNSTTTAAALSTNSDAGTLDADGISLETKHVYLDFNLGKSVNVKTGIMPVKDSLKGVFLDADIAGILTTSKLGSATVTGGYFRYKTESSLQLASNKNPYIDNVSALGHDNADIFILDGKYALNKNLNVGAAYYLLSDYSTINPATIHVLGANADAKIGPATVSGFVAAQYGYSVSAARRASVSAYAANVAAKIAIGPGTLKTAGLFLSGDGDAATGNNNAWNSPGVTTYSEGGMFLLFRTGVGGTTNDRTLSGGNFGSMNNRGAILYTLGYDATITPKLYTNANVGMLWVAKTDTALVNKGTGKTNGGDMLGTEINLETGYKVYDNLTARVQVAYVILGGAFKNTASNATEVLSPENPYTARVGLSYAF